VRSMLDTSEGSSGSHWIPSSAALRRLAAEICSGRFRGGIERMRALGILAVVCLLAQGQVSAQSTPSSANQAQYRELVKKALQEFSLGHWTEARVFFADAHAIWPNARTFRGLGMACYEARSYVEAIHFLDQALTNQTQPLTPKLADEARGILEQARRFVSKLELDTEPADAAVMLDDKPLERGDDGSVLLDPGEHELRATAPGYHSLDRSVVAEAGNPISLHLPLRSVNEPVAPPSAAVKLSLPQPVLPARPSLHLDGQEPGVAATLSVMGVAGIAVGWVYFIVRQQTVERVYDQVVHGQAIRTSDTTAGRTQGIVSLSAAGAGSILLGVAEYFWLPDDASVPTWAWVIGTVGIAAGLTGLGFAIFGSHCDVGDNRVQCQEPAADLFFGPLLIAQALPLITLPIMYALRNRTIARDVQVGLQWRGQKLGDGAQLTISGRF
jgi:hypothetical protein